MGRQVCAAGCPPLHTALCPISQHGSLGTPATVQGGEQSGRLGGKKELGAAARRDTAAQKAYGRAPGLASTRGLGARSSKEKILDHAEGRRAGTSEAGMPRA